jgi:hypothetical protein
MPMHDIFICYSSQDEDKARGVLTRLEARGFKCWISSRDVAPGRNYQEDIVRAIEEAKVILFLFSEASNKTSEVKKELSLASSFGISVIPLRLSPIKPNGALQYELATRQWIDAYPDLDAAFERILSAVEATLHATGSDADRHAIDEPARELATLAPVRTGARPAAAPGISVGSEDFEAIRALLARHVGPIAKVLIERAARDSRTRDEFCDKLAANMRDSADRTQFLRALRNRLPAD